MSQSKKKLSTGAKYDQRAYMHLDVLPLFFACTVSTRICVHNINNIEHENDGEQSGKDKQKLFDIRLHI